MGGRVSAVVGGPLADITVATSAEEELWGFLQSSPGVASHSSVVDSSRGVTGHSAEPTDMSLEVNRNMTEPVRRVQVGVMGVVPSVMECKEQKVDMLVVMTNQGGSRDQWSISSERVELKLEYSELEMRVQVAVNCISILCNLMWIQGGFQGNSA